MKTVETHTVPAGTTTTRVWIAGRPARSNTGWVVYVGKQRIGTIDWDADHRWVLTDTDGNEVENFGICSRAEVLHTIADSRGFGWGTEGDRRADTDAQLWNRVYLAARDELGPNADEWQVLQQACEAWDANH